MQTWIFNWWTHEPLVVKIYYNNDSCLRLFLQHTVDGRYPAPGNNGMFTISAGAGFSSINSTVFLEALDHWHCHLLHWPSPLVTWWFRKRTGEIPSKMTKTNSGGLVLIVLIDILCPCSVNVYRDNYTLPIYIQFLHLPFFRSFHQPKIPNRLTMIEC